MPQDTITHDADGWPLLDLQLYLVRTVDAWAELVTKSKAAISSTDSSLATLTGRVDHLDPTVAQLLAAVMGHSADMTSWDGWLTMPTVTVSGLTVTVGPGRAVGGSGTWLHTLTSPTDVTLAAHASQARMDVIVLRAGAVVVIQGTPAASPTAPTPSAGDVTVATMWVPANSGAVTVRSWGAVPRPALTGLHLTPIHKSWTALMPDNIPNGTPLWDDGNQQLLIQTSNGQQVVGDAQQVRPITWAAGRSGGISARQVGGLWWADGYVDATGLTAGSSTHIGTLDPSNDWGSPSDVAWPARTDGGTQIGTWRLGRTTGQLHLDLTAAGTSSVWVTGLTWR